MKNKRQIRLRVPRFMFADGDDVELSTRLERLEELRRGVVWFLENCDFTLEQGEVSFREALEDLEDATEGVLEFVQRDAKFTKLKLRRYNEMKARRGDNMPERTGFRYRRLMARSTEPIKKA